LAALVGALVGYVLVYLIVQHHMRYLYPILFVQSLVPAGGAALWLADRTTIETRPAAATPSPAS
jgi:hypothetical protein